MKQTRREFLAATGGFLAALPLAKAQLSKRTTPEHEGIDQIKIRKKRAVMAGYLRSADVRTTFDALPEIICDILITDIGDLSGINELIKEKVAIVVLPVSELKRIRL